jgi:osmotically-inducible protein OsmY
MKGLAMKTDAQLESDILAELQWDPAIDAKDLTVIVDDGVVTLTGHVSSHAEKHAAERAVQRVHGVKALAVETRVQLPNPFARTDTDIARTAQCALEWNVLVSATHIQLIVDSGWITLCGEVKHNYQRKAAERVVGDLTGVIGVTNLINVVPSISTADVEKNIQAALERQADRAAKHLEIVVDGSNVTLRGKVHSLAERRAIQGAAWSAPGVSSVVNDLTVEA